jgi:hypothetical protein
VQASNGRWTVSNATSSGREAATTPAGQLHQSGQRLHALAVPSSADTHASEACCARKGRKCQHCPMQRHLHNPALP